VTGALIGPSHARQSPRRDPTSAWAGGPSQLISRDRSARVLESRREQCRSPRRTIEGEANQEHRRERESERLEVSDDGGGDRADATAACCGRAAVWHSCLNRRGGRNRLGDRRRRGGPRGGDGRLGRLFGVPCYGSHARRPTVGVSVTGEDGRRSDSRSERSSGLPRRGVTRGRRKRRPARRDGHGGGVLFGPEPLTHRGLELPQPRRSVAG
jgi:hypothetical protein